MKAWFLECKGIAILTRDILLESNIYIGLCSALLSYASVRAFAPTHSAPLPLYYFVFAATIFVYCLHRVIISPRLLRQGYLVSALLLPDSLPPSVKKNILPLTMICSGTGCLLFYLLLPSTTKLYLLPAALLTLLYPLPITLQHKRLREIGYWKIFLIAVVWSYLTMLIPLCSAGCSDYWLLAVLFSKRALFILAITIPFDIRDRQVDSGIGLHTLPLRFGIRGAKFVAIAALALAAAIDALLFMQQSVPWRIPLFCSITYLLSAALILLSSGKEPNYYYTALLDGTMLLHAGMILWL